MDCPAEDSNAPLCCTSRPERAGAAGPDCPLGLRSGCRSGGAGPLSLVVPVRPFFVVENLLEGTRWWLCKPLGLLRPRG